MAIAARVLRERSIHRRLCDEPHSGDELQQRLQHQVQVGEAGLRVEVQVAANLELAFRLEKLFVQDGVLLDEGDDEVRILGEPRIRRKLGNVLDEQIQDVDEATEKEQVL